MIAGPGCARRVRSSRAGCAVRLLGLRVGSQKGPERNSHYPAANRPGHFGCPHKMGFLRERGGDRQLVGLAPGWPLPWEGWGELLGWTLGPFLNGKVDY